MASVTVWRTFEVPGGAPTHGVLCVAPFMTRSAVFDAGGYEWSLYFNPDARGDGHWIGIYLQLETPGAAATVQVGFSLLDPSGSRPPWRLTEATAPTLLRDSGDLDRKWTGCTVSRSDVVNSAPGPGFLTRGGLLFDCAVTVFTDDDDADDAPPLQATKRRKVAPPPPPSFSDMAEQLARIYADKEGTDVTYTVGGVMFPAHKVVLAMASPVFRAGLFGDLAEGTRTTTRSTKAIQVKGIQPRVFKALLDYIYTDMLPVAGDDDEHAMTEMVRGLLVAADRYCVGRLKLLCELELCRALTVDNVAKMLEFADDLHCDVLKDACIQFMVTDDRMDGVKESQGYMELRRTNPLVLLEVLEKSNQFQTAGH